MNKVLFTLLAVSIIGLNKPYCMSTKAPVTMAGGIIKAKHMQDATIKYKRKDCPVCKGKGWYMSGDDIKKIECSYCEPDTSGTPSSTTSIDCQNNKCILKRK